MSYEFVEIADKHLEEAKHYAIRTTHLHLQKRNDYDSEEKFIADLVGKIVERTFLDNVRYTEEVVMAMLKQIYDIKD
jgi:hypothetical protein